MTSDNTFYYLNRWGYTISFSVKVQTCYGNVHKLSEVLMNFFTPLPSLITYLFIIIFLYCFQYSKFHWITFYRNISIQCWINSINVEIQFWRTPVDRSYWTNIGCRTSFVLRPKVKKGLWKGARGWVFNFE